MVEISEIVNHIRLEEWLTEQSNTPAATIIAHRAAMRVLPIAWMWLDGRAGKRVLADMSNLWANLTSGVVGFARTPEIIRAAHAAAVAAHTGHAEINAKTREDHASADYAVGSAAFAASSPDDCFAAEYAAIAISEDAGFDLWPLIQADCAAIKVGTLLSERPLWLGFKNPLKSRWGDLSVAMKQNSCAGMKTENSAGLDWSFWIDWYKRALYGTEDRWKMLTAIALIKEEIWLDDPTVLMAEINKIVAECEENAVPSYASEGLVQVFQATLFDFSYDHAEAVMRAVALHRDWKHLDDPGLLASFLQDADDLRDDLELFCEALQSEGTAMQGAGIVRTYCSALLKELDRARQVDSLRVGKLIQYGRLIENARLDPSTQAEFGLLAPALQDNAQAVLDLMRNHFSRTLNRFADLRGIGLEEDASRWEVLQGFRDLVAKAQTADGADRPALAQEDAAVLSDILDSVDRQMRALDVTQDEGVAASLKRDMNFEMAKLGATIAIYRERAVGVETGAGKAADLTLKWEKRGLGLMGILTKLKDLL